jgi:hypothetical protein
LPQNAITSADFTLAAAAPTLIGRVTSATGRALKGVNIRVTSSSVVESEASITNISTDDQGHFAAWAPNGAVDLWASAEGYRSVRVRTSVPTFDIEITLYPGYTVTGQVINEGDATPVSNVRVTATTNATGTVNSADPSVLTDQRGNFRLEGVALGNIVLGVAEKHLWGRTTVAVSPIARNDNVKIVVRSAIEVSGRLSFGMNDLPCLEGQLQMIPREAIDAKGVADMTAAYEAAAPLQGSLGAAKNPPLTAAVDKNGEVNLLAVPTGDYAVIAICDEYQLTNGPGFLSATREDILGQQWEFEEGVSLRVSVTDENDHAVAAASLELRPSIVGTITLEQARANPEAYAVRTGQTDAKGVYRFGRMKIGAYEIVAHGPGVSGDLQVRKFIHVDANTANEPVTLTLPATGAIEIHARALDGKPISRLLFHADDSRDKRFEARYAGNGRYDIGPLPQDLYRVYAYDNKNPKIVVPGASGETIRIDTATPVVLDLQYDTPHGVIEGVVVDAFGKPTAAAIQAVSASLNETDERYASLQTDIQGEQYRITDENGRFKIKGLQINGSYRLFVDTPTGQKLEQKNVSPGQFVQITLPALATIAGTVVTSKGEPVKDFVVIAQVGESDVRSEEFSTTNGRYSLRGISPGDIRLSAISADHRLHGTTTTKLASGESRMGVQIIVTEGGAESD